MFYILKSFQVRYKRLQFWEPGLSKTVMVFNLLLLPDFFLLLLSFS